MKQGEASRAAPWLALLASALALTLGAAPTELQAACALTRDGLAGGELWRLWSGHFVHFGDAHLRGDLIAFSIWAAWLERGSRDLLLRVLLVAAPLLSVAVLLGCPPLDEYRGLSGLDCSLVGALIWRRGLQSQQRRGVGLWCLAAFVTKCGYELVTGRAIFAPDLGEGVRLLPLAHLAGALLGISLSQRFTTRARGPSAGWQSAGA